MAEKELRLWIEDLQFPFIMNGFRIKKKDYRKVRDLLAKLEREYLGGSK